MRMSELDREDLTEDEGSLERPHAKFLIDNYSRIQKKVTIPLEYI